MPVTFQWKFCASIVVTAVSATDWFKASAIAVRASGDSANAAWVILSSLKWCRIALASGVLACLRITFKGSWTKDKLFLELF